MANLKTVLLQTQEQLCHIVLCVDIFIYIKNEVCSWQILGWLPWALEGSKIEGGAQVEKKTRFH